MSGVLTQGSPGTVAVPANAVVAAVAGDQIAGLVVFVADDFAIEAGFTAQQAIGIVAEVIGLMLGIGQFDQSALAVIAVGRPLALGVGDANQLMA